MENFAPKTSNMKHLENATRDPNRNAFEDYFKSSNEFRSVVLNKFRAGEIRLDSIRKDGYGFVALLIGDEEAKRLSPEEVGVFCAEAEKVILGHEKMIADSERLQADEAERSGIISEFSRGADGDVIPHGNPEDYEKYIND